MTERSVRITEPKTPNYIPFSGVLSILSHLALGALFFLFYAKAIYKNPPIQEEKTIEVTVTDFSEHASLTSKPATPPAPIKQILKPTQKNEKKPVTVKKNTNKPLPIVKKNAPAAKQSEKKIINFKPVPVRDLPPAQKSPPQEEPTGSTSPVKNAVSSSALTTQTSPQPVVISEQAKTNALNRYISGVKIKAEGAKTYPIAARMRNVEGTAVLQIGVVRSGALASAHIVQSSGSKTLDTAAIKAVRAAAPFGSFPKELQQDKIQVQLPFRFNLN